MEPPERRYHCELEELREEVSGEMPIGYLAEEYELNAEAVNSCAIDFIAVVGQIARRLLPGKGLNHLLYHPPACWVFGDVEVDDLPTLVAQHEEHVHDSKSGRWDNE